MGLMRRGLPRWVVENLNPNDEALLALSTRHHTVQTKSFRLAASSCFTRTECVGRGYAQCCNMGVYDRLLLFPSHVGDVFSEKPSRWPGFQEPVSVWLSSGPLPGSACSRACHHNWPQWPGLLYLTLVAGLTRGDGAPAPVRHPATPSVALAQCRRNQPRIHDELLCCTIDDESMTHFAALRPAGEWRCRGRAFGRRACTTVRSTKAVL